MSLISIKFAVFVVAVCFIYFILPKKTKWMWLLLASYMFYFLSSKKLTIFILITTISTYLITIWINKINEKTKKECKDKEKEEKKKIKNKASYKKKWLVAIAIIINIGLLVFLKYSNFIGKNINRLNKILNISFNIPMRNIILPLGISYYTLQAIGYVIDVYRGKNLPEKNIAKLALFLAYFPQMTEGPIGRYENLAEQLYEPHEFDYKRIKFGLQLILWGLFKKLVIADRAGMYVNEVFGSFSDYCGITIVMAVILYTIQIYAEFSGCIEIVSGISEILGIKLAENFKRPFFSKNIQEFWRRWHITLGTWLKDYIFYPISFSKLCINLTSKSKQIFKGHLGKIIPAIFALFFVWITNGIWHGASWKYIFYGLYYYILMVFGMILEPLFKKIIEKFKIDINSFGHKLWQMLRTTVVVLGGMLIFRAHRLKTALKMFKSIFTLKNIETLFNGKLYKIGFNASDFVVIIIGVIIMFIVSLLQEKGYNIREKISKQNIIFRWTLYYGIIFAIIIFGAYGNGYNASDFIYGQF